MAVTSASSAVNGSDLITQLGAGSGTNTRTLAESLVEVERKPREDAINGRIKKAENRISGLSAVMLSLDTIKKSFQSLDDPSDWTALNIQNSNAAALTATPSASGSSAVGAQSVEVLGLASAQRSASAGFAASDTVLNGGQAFSLRLSVNGGATSTVNVTADKTSPAGMVAAINAAKLGVSAQLVNTNDGSASPYKIIVTGASGANNQFTLSSDGGGGTGEQQTLSFGPATATGRISVQGVLVDVTAGDSAGTVAAKVKAALDGSSFITNNPGRSAAAAADGKLTITYKAAEGDVGAPSWGDVGGTGVSASYATTREFTPGTAVAGVNFGTTLTAAANAQIKVNGLTLVRASNTISDAIPGVTLNLQAKTTSPLQLDLTRDPSKLKEKVQTLVKSFNDAMSDFNVLGGAKNEKDPTDVYSGSLANDATLAGVRTQIRNLFIADSSTPASGARALRDIGVSIQRDGSLTLDETKLDKAVQSNYSDIVTMFTADRENKGTTGTSKRGLAGDAVKRLTDLMASGGLVMTQTGSSEQQIVRYKSDLSKLETRMTALLARYTAQFSTMDSIVGNANSMRTYLENQFKAMSNSSN